MTLVDTGQGNRTTRTFTVPSRWILRWQYSCGDARGRFRIVVYSRTRKRAPIKEVNKHGHSGRGTRHAISGGTPSGYGRAFYDHFHAVSFTVG